MLIPVDLSVFPEKVRKGMAEVFTREAHVKHLAALARQNQIARFFHENQPKAKEGIGGVTMAVDSYWRNWWSWHLGTAECWDSKEFTDWLKKRDERFRVKSTGTRTQVGYGTDQTAKPKKLIVTRGSGTEGNEGNEGGRNKKFSKSFGVI
jgi:hypothetical protein